MDSTTKLLQLQQEVQELSKLLTERCEYLAERNASSLEMLKQLQCCGRMLREGDNTVQTVSNEDARSRKVNHYMSKLKLCIKMYVNLNDKLDSDIKNARRELHRSETDLMKLNVSEDELKLLDTKVKRYENELTKLEKKYPWLKDTQHHLPNIAKETETLNKLRNTKDTLLEEINSYCGLKPDISEANQQLKAIKREYEDVMKNFNEKLERV